MPILLRAIPILLLFPVLIPAGSIFSVVDLGSVGGSSSIAYKINDSGTAVGWAQTSAGVQDAFVSTGSGLQVLPALSNSDSYAYGINSSGTIAGTSVIGGQTHGSIWNGSTVTDLGAGIFATGINDAGVVIGSNGHAFTLSNGTYRDLGLLPGGNWSSAAGINNSGVVVGSGNIDSTTIRGFVWTPGGGMTELSTLGGRDSDAKAINASGEIVGEATLADGSVHAFAAVSAMMTDLGSLGGSSYAYDINNAGEIVGYSWLAAGPSTHAFLYANGVMLDLNSLIATSGWQLLAAYGINNHGQIVGEGLFQGQARAFRLDPTSSAPFSGGSAPATIPDPGTGTLAVIGLSLLFATRVRFRKR
jgi:probable HAF family extracellular repeat protein